MYATVWIGFCSAQLLPPTCLRRLSLFLISSFYSLVLLSVWLFYVFHLVIRNHFINFYTVQTAPLSTHCTCTSCIYGATPPLTVLICGHTPIHGNPLDHTSTHALCRTCCVFVYSTHIIRVFIPTPSRRDSKFY